MPPLGAELGAHEGFDAGECRTQRGGVVAARLGEVGPAAALAANLAGDVARPARRL